MFHLKSDDNSNPMEILPQLLSTIWSFVQLFFVCEIGERVSQEFEMFDETLYQSKWYLFPIELQRMLVIVVSNAQQSVFVQGFGNILCTRDSFKRVRLFFCREKSKYFSSLYFILLLIGCIFILVNRPFMPHFLIS